MMIYKTSFRETVLCHLIAKPLMNFEKWLIYGFVRESSKPMIALVYAYLLFKNYHANLAGLSFFSRLMFHEIHLIYSLSFNIVS